MIINIITYIIIVITCIIKKMEIVFVLTINTSFHVSVSHYDCTFVYQSVYLSVYQIHTQSTHSPDLQKRLTLSPHNA